MRIGTGGGTGGGIGVGSGVAAGPETAVHRSTILLDSCWI